MSSAPAMLWAQLGKPEVDGCGPAVGVCYQCAGPVESGTLVDDWMSSNYTDQNRVRAPLSKVVCSGCVMLARRLWPVPGRPAGKCSGCDGTGQVTNVAKKGKTRNAQVGDPCPKCEGSGQASAGGNWRNYSHLLELDWDAPALPDGTKVHGYANASKGEKPLIRDFLSREHESVWWASVADTGQKHVVPWAPLNAPGRGGLIVFEDQLVHIPENLGLIDDMSALLTAGGTKDEIETGNYRSSTWVRCRGAVELFESSRSTERNGDWFGLALWLAQRNEEETKLRQDKEKEAFSEKKKSGKTTKKGTRNAVSGAKEASGNSSGGNDPGVPQRVHRGKKGTGDSGLLGSDPGDGRSGDERADDPGVGAVPAKGPADKRARQIRMPGFD